MSSSQTVKKEVSLVKKIRLALEIFPGSYVNRENEFILEPENHLYFRLEDVETVLDFECKMFAWLSTPIAKTLDKYWSPIVLSHFNSLFQTDFTRDDMDIISERLGYDVNRYLAIEFIQSDYDVAMLKRNR